MLDIHRLRLLRELKHRGTLAAVARALSYSPSAVSQQLAQLETEAGVKLLEPVGRGVRLTAQAEVLVGHAEALLQRLDMAEADLAASLTQVMGTVRIAAFQTAALGLLPPALSYLADRHPALRVQVTEMEPDLSLPALRTRDCDIVLGEEYPGHPTARLPELCYSDLHEDRMRLAAPFSDPGRDRIELRDFSAHLWVMEPRGTPARAWATAVCRDAGFEPDVRFESTDVLLHVRLVRTGHAVALLPDLVWLSEARLMGLYALPGKPIRRLFTAVRRGSETHPAYRAVREALQTAIVS